MATEVTSETTTHTTTGNVLISGKTNAINVAATAKSRTQDFFSLYDTPEKILGPDLLKKDELELQPDSIQQYKMSLNRTPN